MEVNPARIARLRGGRVGKALEVLDVDVALTSDGRISLKKSIPGDLGAQLVYDGQGSFGFYPDPTDAFGKTFSSVVDADLARLRLGLYHLSM